MKILLVVLIIVFLPSLAIAWGDDYYTSRDDAWEADSYNRGARSTTRDYDHDGTPNYFDLYDNDWYKAPASRDYDNDGTPNAVDLYDNDWSKP